MNNFSNTIAAISTPPGKGGVAIIRISGEDALDIASRIFRPASKSNFKHATPRMQIRGEIFRGEEMLDAVLSLIPLDTYAVENFMLMQTVEGDPLPTIWDKYFTIAKKHDDNQRAGNLERFAFYERAKKAYAVIATGEGAVYANIIIKKGVIK